MSGRGDGGSDELGGDDWQTKSSTWSVPHGSIVRVNDGPESDCCLLSELSCSPTELILPRSTARPNPTEAITIAMEEEIRSTLSRHIRIAHLESGAQQTICVCEECNRRLVPTVSRHLLQQSSGLLALGSETLHSEGHHLPSMSSTLVVIRNMLAALGLGRSDERLEVSSMSR